MGHFHIKFTFYIFYRCKKAIAKHIYPNLYPCGTIYPTKKDQSLLQDKRTRKWLCQMDDEMNEKLMCKPLSVTWQFKAMDKWVIEKKIEKGAAVEESGEAFTRAVSQDPRVKWHQFLLLVNTIIRVRGTIMVQPGSAVCVGLKRKQC